MSCRRKASSAAIPSAPASLARSDQIVEQLHPLLERAAEALLLRVEPLANRVPLLAELRVRGAHQLGHTRREAREKAGIELERMAPLEDRAADDAPQHVAAILVRGHDAVRDQEAHRATVVGEDPQGAVGGEIVAVLAPRELLAELDQRRELVGLEHRLLVLEDRGEPVEPEAGVDVLGRQRRQRVDRVLVELHEHEVPVLQEALVVAAREIVRLAELDAAIEIQLRARAARTRRPDLPEVLRARALHDPLARNANLEPCLDRLLVGPEAELVIAGENRDPDILLAEPEALERQLPGVTHRLALEVVAEREVPEHLEERQVPRRRADDLDVGRPERLLAGGRTRMRWAFGTQEVRLQGMHAGNREQG